MAKIFTIGLMGLLVTWALQGCDPHSARNASRADPTSTQIATQPSPPAIHPPSSAATWIAPICATSPFLACTQSDLREANFHQAELSGHVVFFNANAEGSNFSEANLSNSALHFANLQSANLESTNMMGADLPGANLMAANLERAQLRNINCLACNLSLSQLTDSDLHGANLRGANMSYADLSGANLSQADITQVLWHQSICPDGSTSEDNGNTCGGHLTKRTNQCGAQPKLNCPDQDLSRVDWRGANLNHANLEASDLRQALLVGANLQHTNLAHANLRGANLSHADLLGANLLRANLEKASWTGSRCPDGTLSHHNGNTCGGHLDSEILPCPVGPQAACAGADLSGRDLSFANLAGADLQGSDLRGTRLRGANLEQAKLQNANLQGADLTRANITGVLTEGANLADITALNTTCSNRFSAMHGINCSEER